MVLGTMERINHAFCSRSVYVFFYDTMFIPKPLDLQNPIHNPMNVDLLVSINKPDLPSGKKMNQGSSSLKITQGLGKIKSIEEGVLRVTTPEPEAAGSQAAQYHFSMHLSFIAVPGEGRDM